MSYLQKRYAMMLKEKVAMNVSLNPILACQDLIKIYQDGSRHVSVLNGIDLQVMPGQTVAIVGRSGSGKTTLLNILGGLELPTQGAVQFGQVDLSTLNDRRRGRLRNEKIGLIFQFHHLLPEFNALENVCMPLLIRKTNVAQAKKLGLAVLEKVGLLHRKDHKPRHLSGGERQRVAIARAFVTSPECILADEPTGNLDHESANGVYNLMMDMSKEKGTSFVVVTHDLNMAARMDKILSLEMGKIVTQSPKPISDL